MAISKFYGCKHCGNVITPLVDARVTPFCCGEKMTFFEPGSVDAAREKHVPVIEKSGDGQHVTVSIGEVAHPMTDEHHIAFIVLVAGACTFVRKLTPDDAPQATFCLKDSSKPFAVYEYCNLHGLWKADA